MKMNGALVWGKKYHKERRQKVRKKGDLRWAYLWDAFERLRRLPFT